jgi:hypothetical protein
MTSQTPAKTSETPYIVQKLVKIITGRNIKDKIRMGIPRPGGDYVAPGNNN